MMNRRHVSSVISITKQTKTSAFVKKARLLRQKGSPSNSALATQTCGKWSRESDKVCFKNKSKVERDSEIKPNGCSECIAFSNKLHSIFKEPPELRSAYAIVDKDALLHEDTQKNPQAIKAALAQALESKTSISNETTFEGKPIEAWPSGVHHRDSEVVYAPDAWLYAL